MLPQQTPNGDNLILGKGAVYFALRNTDGSYQAYRHMGNVKTFEIGAADDVLEKRSSMDAANSLLKSVTRSRDVTIRMEADEFVPENVALALGAVAGTSSAQVATPVVAEELTADAVLGGSYKLAKRGPYTSVTVNGGATGTTALTEGDDYRFDDVAGIVTLLEGATTAADGDIIKVDYTPTAYSAGLPQVAGGTKAVAEGHLMFVGDPTVGPKMIVEVWNVNIRPSAALALIGDDWGTQTLEAKAQLDTANHPDAPLYLITYIP